jgi:1,4-alpha-glucan branching enzyme
MAAAVTQHQSFTSDTFEKPVSADSLYRYWGAHPVPGGVRYAVWAPDAKEVSVISDGNGWTPERDWLNSGNDGVWSAVIAGAVPGTRYKFAIRTRSGHLLEKADPVAFSSEMRPQTASIVCNLQTGSELRSPSMKFTSVPGNVLAMVVRFSTIVNSHMLWQITSSRWVIPIFN